jgi:hypothetical protein
VCGWYSKAGIQLQGCQRSKTVDFRYAEHSVVLPDLHTKLIQAEGVFFEKNFQFFISIFFLFPRLYICYPPNSWIVLQRYTTSFNIHICSYQYWRWIFTFDCFPIVGGGHDTIDGGILYLLKKQKYKKSCKEKKERQKTVPQKPTTRIIACSTRAQYAVLTEYNTCFCAGSKIFHLLGFFLPSFPILPWIKCKRYPVGLT